MNNSRTIHPNRTVVTSFSPDATAIKQRESNGMGDEYDVGVYILEVAVASSAISCALSNHSINIYDRSTMKQVRRLINCHERTIHDLVHFGSSGEFLMSSGGDGLVKVFDLRSNNNSAALTLKMPKPDQEALSVSVGYDGVLTAVGVSKGNIHFYDIRKPRSTHQQHSPLGTYHDAHTDDVTKVRFQPASQASQSSSTTAILASASQDNLLSIHDTSQPTEETALKSVCNVSSPIRDIGFFGPNYQGLYCLTNNESLSLWHYESAQPIHDFGYNVRSHLSSLSAGMEMHYLLGCHWDDTPSSQQLHLIAGNSNGDAAIFRVDGSSLSCTTKMHGGHKASLRSFAWPAASSQASLFAPTIFFTGGEDARLCEWNLTGGSNAHSTTTTDAGNNNNRQHVSASSSTGGQSELRKGGGATRRKMRKSGSATPY